MVNYSKKGVKRNNQLRIIELLRSSGGMSRKTIAEKLSLTRASITQLSNELIQIGILHEVGIAIKQTTTVGPKEILIAINEDFKYILGIDIEIDRVSLGLVTLNGKAITTTSFKFDFEEISTDVFNEFIRHIKSGVKTLLRRRKITFNKILYCGVGIIGREYYYQTRNINLPPLFGLKDKVVDSISKFIPVPISFENNVRSLALAELMFHQQTNTSSFLFVKVEPGIGSAIVLDNKLYRGERNHAGEIGSSIVSEFYERKPGDTKIYLEDIISNNFIKNEIVSDWSASSYPYLFDILDGNIENINLANINKALKKGDTKLISLFKQKMHILACRIYDYTTLLDLNTVSLYFSSDSPEFLHEVLIDEFNSLSSLNNVRIKLSDINKNQMFIGGAALAVTKTFEMLSDISNNLPDLL